MSINGIFLGEQTAGDMVAAVMVHETADSALSYLRTKVASIRTAADRDAVLSEASVFLEQVEAAKKDRPVLNEAALSSGVKAEVVEARLSGVAESLRSVIYRARKAAVIRESATPLQEALTDEDFQARRSMHSRRSFCVQNALTGALQEMAQGRASFVQESSTPKVGALPVSERDKARREKTRQVSSINEAVAASRLRAVAEVAFRAVPFDAEEKDPHRSIMIEQVEELARVGGGQGTAASLELFEQVDAIVLEVGAEGAVERVSEEARDPDSALGRVVERIGALIESRVVSAYNAARAEAEQTERALREAAELSGDDEELAATRRRRIEGAARPRLLESLYAANARVLSESAGGDLPKEAILTESVGQYTAIETLSALGVAEIPDAETLARNIARVRPAA